MSCFNSCYRELQRFSTFSPSHTWIYLHWCVEAYARLTGEPFTIVFKELEQQFGFEREITRKWPDLKQMLQAGEYLHHKRTDFLKHYDILVAKRKSEKKQGKRQPMNQELIAISRRQLAHRVPEVGMWGWKKLREAK